MAPVFRRRLAPTEISGDDGRHAVQPDIVAVERDHAERGVEQRHHALACATRTACLSAPNLLGKYATATRLGLRSFTLHTPSRVSATDSTGVAASISCL